MKPVVVDPKITFTQMEQEIRSVTTEEQKILVRDQFAAKLQRKKRHLPESAVVDFETLTGMEINEFVETIRKMSADDAIDWFKRHAGIGEILDRKSDRAPDPIYISEHPDEFLSAERGYGQAVKPKDYIEEFAKFIKSRQNEIPALLTVMTRPRELTRKQLRELALELDKAGFSEQNLATAWREMTNQDIAARIVGYIRQAAVGDTLLPYEQRVESALQKMLTSRNWTTPQRQWLQKIAAQTKANVIVDRDAIDDPDLIFMREGGGFLRLDRLFNGNLQAVLESFNESIWQAA
jgi:type I restriction enzyme R subunit